MMRDANGGLSGAIGLICRESSQRVRSASILARARSVAPGARVPAARARRPVQHRRPAAQPHGARPRSRPAARRDAGRGGARVTRRFRQPRARVRRAPGLCGRRAADSRQEHRRVSHGSGCAAAHRRRGAHARAPAAARMDSAPPADDDGEPLAAGGPLGALPYKVLSVPIMHGAQQMLGVLVLFKPPRGAGLRPATGPGRRAARAPRRLHPHECVRPGDRVC